MESSITTVKRPRRGFVSLNPGDETARPFGRENMVSDKGLVGPSGWGNM